MVKEKLRGLNWPSMINPLSIYRRPQRRGSNFKTSEVQNEKVNELFYPQKKKDASCFLNQTFQGSTVAELLEASWAVIKR